MTAPQHPQPTAPPPFAPQAPGYAQQPAPGQWTGGPGGYVSPIPVRKATLADALTAEWTKIRSVRSTIWTLGVMLVLILGIGFLAAALVNTADGDLGSGASPLTFGFFGVLLGVICVITLGVLTISSEYGTGLIRTTLTACPDRARVLTAKATVFFLLTFVLTLVSTTLVALLDSALLSDQADADLTGEMWFKATVGISLFVGAMGLIALAMGTLLRHSAGAITVMLGLVLLPLVVAMFMFSSSLSDVREALFQYSIPNQLAVFYETGNSHGSAAENGPAGWEPLWIVLGLAVAAMAGAYASLLKRDA
ncbi:ABC transporter permease subunit [Streptomyces sp. ISL-11]|uniref:ABC transporter permease subunit n=1 Tax=Streptomyces sp. ISL-11 TaxID=2819174 RepID=UPI001BE6A64F|nr:ABC transporter permease subunit [Streptomyces sp. ISL-11]MBT2384361.1 ABC transporter permease subunit [Streptomyces sp. ISL-11]